MQACETNYDVIIIGAGLAGLTAGLQLLRRRPETRVAILEKKDKPLPEQIGTVGESCVELGAHYFDTVLGMKAHLDQAQLPKLGLRYFLDAPASTPLHERFEVGNNRYAPTPSYQLDRSRFENALRSELLACGAMIVSAAAVRQFSRDNEQYLVKAGSFEGRSRWLIDASGRAGVLRKKFGLAQETSHRGTAAWWRLAGEHRIDNWCDDPQWSAQNQGAHARWFSTNHLMGKGYWVWIIPLATGATSFGIVADPNMHAFDDIRSFERALEWLARHEQQLAEYLRTHRDSLLDFAAFKNYSYSCSRVFSPERWALSGEAGLFIDPFYSPGSDFIALANGYLSDLVVRDLAGEQIGMRSEIYNELFLRFARSTTVTFEGQYGILGNPLVMPIKVFWDWCFYWHFLARLYFEDALCDLRFISRERSTFERLDALSQEMQKLFRRWNEVERPTAKNAFLDLAQHPYLFQLNSSLSQAVQTPFEERFAAGVAALEQIADEIAEAFRKRCGSWPRAEAARSHRGPAIFTPYFHALESCVEDSPMQDTAVLTAAARGHEARAV